MALTISLFWTESDKTTEGKYSPISFSQIQSMNLTKKWYKKDSIMKLTTEATVLNSDVHNVWNKHYCYVDKELQYICSKVYLNNLAVTANKQTLQNYRITRQSGYM